MNVLQRLLLAVGLVSLFSSTSYAQMNRLQQQQMQQMGRNMEMQEHRAAMSRNGSGVRRNLGVETVVMPDGHIVEYHHVNKGPVVVDSIPYVSEMKLHWVPFVAMKQTRLLERHISSSPFKPGFSAGVRADWYKDGCNSFYISTGLNYAMMNLFYEGEANRPFSINTKLHVFCVPIFAGYQFRLNENMKLGLGVGAQFGAFISAESKEKGRASYNPYGNFDSTVGPELWFSYKHLQFGFQYDWGFQELVYQQSAFVEYESSNRQTMTFHLGYRLWNE